MAPRAAAGRRPRATSLLTVGVGIGATMAAVLLLSSVGDPALNDTTAPVGPTFALPVASDTDAGIRRSDALRGAGIAGLVIGSSLWPGAAHSNPAVRGETVKLNNGLDFPKASFGLQVYSDATGKKLTELSIELGYRNFFASVLAGNQRGFAEGFKASGIAREEVFICGTVLSNRARGFEAAYKSTKKGIEQNLKDLGVGGITYVDQIMLDYPGPDCDSIKGQWKAFEEMLAAGQTKSLAVSNFSPEQLDCLASVPGATVPTVNQLPYGVGSYDPLAVEENKKRGVIVQAWSPLSRLGGKAKKACEEIGQKYKKSAYQVALRWIIDTGATFSTQTQNKEHFTQDLDIFDFQLTKEEVDRLNGQSNSFF
eukprot:TRINITY_DN4712_c0_g4_i1.p1 TRINITY_DN4712_c0_g4~~TRINITY_DN4712_c0_g4_i1.p1  ORF type:complete len:368 (+),score=77.93 TRINITY_DN4712_c0_g4_i1:103-1206(+)